MLTPESPVCLPRSSWRQETFLLQAFTLLIVDLGSTLCTPTESASAAEFSTIFSPVHCELLENRFLFDYGMEESKREREEGGSKEERADEGIREERREERKVVRS